MPTGLTNKLPSSKKPRARAVLLTILFFLIVTGGSIYFVQTQRAAAAPPEPAPQTATVRQGSLVLSASGSGNLAASEEIELSFSTGGQVTGIFVKPGDLVEAGTLLAQIDPQKAQIDYTQAKQAYQELTSVTAIASAQQQVAQALADLMSAKYQLEYLISPEVLYWETEIANGERALAEAEARVEASPADKDSQGALTKAKQYLSFAQDKLDEAWELYYDEYVPETFPLLEDRNDKDIYAVPTDLEIRLARTTIEEAQKTLTDSQDYYNVLVGGPMPEEASSDTLVQLQQAERNLQDAQTALEGTKIVALITGTILSVEASMGDMVRTETDTNTETVTGAVIVMADLSQLVVDFYLDETDWDLVTVGDRAEVTFTALPDQTIPGHVIQVDSELYQSNNTSVIAGSVQLDSDLDRFELPIGTSASLDIIHAQVEAAVLVPIEALHETAPGEYEVFVVENGTLTQRAVEIGLQDQLYAEVKSGLKAGDVVSTDPVNAD
jgi:multidrug efflux pump subunit AcrA (membrane-fusion protein)